MAEQLERPARLERDDGRLAHRLQRSERDPAEHLALAEDLRHADVAARRHDPQCEVALGDDLHRVTGVALVEDDVTALERALAGACQHLVDGSRVDAAKDERRPHGSKVQQEVIPW